MRLDSSSWPFNCSTCIRCSACVFSAKETVGKTKLDTVNSKRNSVLQISVNAGFNCVSQNKQKPPSSSKHTCLELQIFSSLLDCFQKSATYLSKCKLSGAAVPHGHLSPPLLIKFRFSGSGTLTAKMVSSIQNNESKLFKSSQTTAVSSQQSMTEASWRSWQSAPRTAPGGGTQSLIRQGWFSHHNHHHHHHHTWL